MSRKDRSERIHRERKVSVPLRRISAEDAPTMIRKSPGLDRPLEARIEHHQVLLTDPVRPQFEKTAARRTAALPRATIARLDISVI